MFGIIHINQKTNNVPNENIICTDYAITSKIINLLKNISAGNFSSLSPFPLLLLLKDHITTKCLSSIPDPLHLQILHAFQILLKLLSAPLGSRVGIQDGDMPQICALSKWAGCPLLDRAEQERIWSNDWENSLGKSKPCVSKAVSRENNYRNVWNNREIWVGGREEGRKE